MITSAKDFCFYLLGVIDGATAVEPEKVIVVNRRLQSVLQSKAERNASNTYIALCRWLGGLIDGLNDNAPLDSVRVEKVRARLKDVLGEDTPETKTEDPPEQLFRC